MWYLAMTGAQIAGCLTLPEHVAWMACEFSLRNPGLGNLPRALPAGSVVILSDQNPMTDHDPNLIARQLADLVQAQQPSGILLDLQRQADYKTLIHTLCRELSCPVAVTENYAKDAPCAVLVSPPLNISLPQAIAPWQGRQIWLDMPVGAQHFTVTKEGCAVSHITPADQEEYPRQVEHLHCRCRQQITADAVRFSLCRNGTHLPEMLKQAQKLGITHVLSLYAEVI